MLATPQALFIDFDGTLCDDRFWSSLPGAEECARELLFLPPFELVEQWMKGRKSSEEINDLLAQASGISYGSLWKAFVTDCSGLRIEQALLNSIQLLQGRGIPVILVTDNMDCFSRFTAPSLKLGTFFAHVVNSADHGILKREGLLEIALNAAGVSVKDSLFLDNSPANCRTFERLGGQSVCVTCIPHTATILRTLHSPPNTSRACMEASK